MTFINPDSEQIRLMLRSVHTIAVVGLSPNAERPSYRVARALQSLGFRIVPVHPQAVEVLGAQAYTDLACIPFKVDLVDVFRAAIHVPAIVDSCIALRLGCLWLQEGVIHNAAALRAQKAGIAVVMDRCLWRDCAALR